MPAVHIFNCIWIYTKTNQLDDSSMQFKSKIVSISIEFKKPTRLVVHGTYVVPNMDQG
jgi:hypothetical protein